MVVTSLPNALPGSQDPGRSVVRFGCADPDDEPGPCGGLWMFATTEDGGRHWNAFALSRGTYSRRLRKQMRSRIRWGPGEASAPTRNRSAIGERPRRVAVTQHGRYERWNGSEGGRIS